MGEQIARAGRVGEWRANPNLDKARGLASRGKY